MKKIYNFLHDFLLITTAIILTPFVLVFKGGKGLDEMWGGEYEDEYHPYYNPNK